MQPLPSMQPPTSVSPAQTSTGAGQQVDPAVGVTPHSEESMESGELLDAPVESVTEKEPGGAPRGSPSGTPPGAPR